MEPNLPPKDPLRFAWRPLRLALIVLAIFLGISIPIFLLMTYGTGGSQDAGLGGFTAALFFLFFVPIALFFSVALFPLTILSLYRSIKIYKSNIEYPKKIKSIFIADIILSLIFILSAVYFLMALFYIKAG